MNRQKTGISTRQRLAIAALLTGASSGEACTAAGVGASRMGEWMRQPVFLDALRTAENGIIDGATRQLLAGQADAIGEIRSLIAGMGDVPAAVRLRAAIALLELSLQFHERQTIEGRLAALEELVKDRKL